MATNQAEEFQAIKRKVRLILLLEAALKAGLSPVPVKLLHAFAYLANVLSPVWDLPPLEGKILKKARGPFYPEFQHDLDILVGIGMAQISEAKHVNEGGRWHLEGRFEIRPEFCQQLLAMITHFEEEQKMRFFITELAYALAAIGKEELENAILEDATYANPLNGDGSVVDFAEWKKENISKNAANLFSKYTAEKQYTSPGKKIHLYVRHLYRRAYAV